MNTPSERHGASLHDDTSHDLKSCFEKYGISHQSLIYCLHITTADRFHKKRRSSEENSNISELLDKLLTNKTEENEKVMKKTN